MTSSTKFKIESGEQLLARLLKKPGIVNFFPILFQPGLKHGDTVEIFGDVSTSYLLIDFICEALLSNDVKQEDTGVLVFNTAGQFNYEEFVVILQRRILFSLDSKQDTSMRNADNDKLLYKVLSNFHLLEIYDATQFYTTIHNLDNILTKIPNISLLLFDSLTAFYWSEQGFIVTKMDLYMKNIISLIQKNTNVHNIIIVYTRPKYFNSAKDTDISEFSEVSDDAHYKLKLRYCGDSKGLYEVNVKTSKFYYKKCFNISNNVIKWEE